MRIAMQTGSESSAYELASATRAMNKPVGPVDFCKTASRMLQTQSAIEKEAVDQVNRKNRSCIITFSAEIEFTTLDASDNFAINADNLIPGSGTLLLGKGSGPNYDYDRILNAQIETIITKQDGVSVLITYQIKGGIVSP